MNFRVIPRVTFDGDDTVVQVLVDEIDVCVKITPDGVSGYVFDCVNVKTLSEFAVSRRGALDVGIVE